MTPQAIVTLAADTASADATFFFRVRGERMSLEIATREPTEPTLHELAALVLDRPRSRESRFRLMRALATLRMWCVDASSSHSSACMVMRVFGAVFDRSVPFIYENAAPLCGGKTINIKPKHVCTPSHYNQCTSTRVPRER